MNFILRVDKMMKCELVLCVSTLIVVAPTRRFIFFLIPFLVSFDCCRQRRLNFLIIMCYAIADTYPNPSYKKEPTIELICGARSLIWIAPTVSPPMASSLDDGVGRIFLIGIARSAASSEEQVSSSFSSDSSSMAASATDGAPRSIIGNDIESSCCWEQHSAIV